MANLSRNSQASDEAASISSTVAFEHYSRRPSAVPPVEVQQPIPRRTAFRCTSPNSFAGFSHRFHPLLHDVPKVFHVFFMSFHGFPGVWHGFL